jgi:uncharacterized protein YkwD
VPIPPFVQGTPTARPLAATAGPRRRRAAPFVVLALADEGTAVTLLNRDRVANSRAALLTNEAAITKAQGWARHLANGSGGQCNTNTLYHSNLSAGAPAGWKRLGENVACRTWQGSVASIVPVLQADLMNSPGHKANILNSNFTHVGIGIAAVSTGTNRWTVFETQYFVQL